jgi:hypothetical protein
MGFFVSFLSSMAWPSLNIPKYESLIATKLACNHDHHSMSEVASKNTRTMIFSKLGLEILEKTLRATPARI